MHNGWNWIGWGIVVGLTSFPAWSAEPYPEEVQRQMEIYRRDLEAEEATKKAPAPKSRTKPAPAPKPASKPAPKAQPTPTVNYDHEAWKSAEKCGTAACFEAYLEEYPKGRYARMAKARLKTEPMPSSAPPSLSSQVEAAREKAVRAAVAREEAAARARAAAAARAAALETAPAAAARAAALETAPAAAARAATLEAAPIELQSRSMTSAPARVPAIPTLPTNTPNGGSVVASYAMQENANALRDYYRSQKIRAVVEETEFGGRPLYRVRIFRSQ